MPVLLTLLYLELSSDKGVAEIKIDVESHLTQEYKGFKILGGFITDVQK